ncbi:MAG: hypothetical protein ABIS18_10415 [Actinomycetota bacterium]
MKRAGLPIILALTFLAAAWPLQAGVAAEPVVRRAPYDSGSFCAQHRPVNPAYPSRYTTCSYSPPRGNDSNDPLDPLLFQLNNVAVSAQYGVLAAGGYHQLYLPPVPTTYVYNIKRSQSIVYLTTPGPGTLSVSADIAYQVASFPDPRKYRTCLEAYDETTGRGTGANYGHGFLGNDCAFEDQNRTHFSFSITVSQATPLPVALEAVLDNTGDNSAATGVVDNITYTFTPA